MDSTTLIYVLSAAFLLSLGLSFIALRTARDDRARLAEQTLAYQRLQEDIQALCAGAVGLDKRISGIEERSRRMKERQEQLELRDNGERLYNQAIRMVHKGADAEQLMSVCGLSKAEAELITMMHRVDEAS